MPVQTPAESREIRPASIGRRVGASLSGLRDAVASGLLRRGATPNAITIVGLLFTTAAAAGLLFGAGHVWPLERRIFGNVAESSASLWPLLTASCLTLAGAMDMLDGAVARLGGQRSSYGALLDSTLDRCGDGLLFAGCALHFTLSGNLTYVALSLNAGLIAMLISYVKARAESLGVDCEIGFWQRGERLTALLVAAWFGHVPAALWVLGTLPTLTFIARLKYACRQLAHAAHAHELVARANGPCAPPMNRRHKPEAASRAAWWYDAVVVLHVLFFAIAPALFPIFTAGADPLRRLIS